MKTEAIKRVINAVDVWVACGVFDGTNFNPNTDDAKTELEQLALHSVSQQRELLEAFITWYNAKPKAKKGELIYVNDIIEFLKP